MSFFIAPSRRLFALGTLFIVSIYLTFSASGKESIHKLAQTSARGTAALTRNSFPFLEHPPANKGEKVTAPLVRAIADFTLLNRINPPSHFNVSLCSIATHEEDFLVEWITWHRLLGVERIYLFDNSPKPRMRKLLRPWLEEGSVVLFELNYPDDVLIGAHHRADLLRICESEVLSTSRWAAHIDVDEFLIVEPPESKPQIPHPLKTEFFRRTKWTYPLHEVLQQLDEATCVPIPRITFANVGVREMGPDYVTERHVLREKKEVGRSTWGKMLLHWPDPTSPRPATWWGPHSCQASNGNTPEANIIMDALGNRLSPPNNIYPMKGLVLPDQGLGINHYAQRSLLNCIHKAEVVKEVHTDWRAMEGPLGCAQHYVPSEEELEDGARKRILIEDEFGAELLIRPTELFGSGAVQDPSARDSWTGRMTRAILDEWRGQSGTLSWPWEESSDSEEETQFGIRRISAPVRQGD